MTTLFAALSFEERCTAGFRSLIGHERKVAAVFFDYHSDATPGAEALYARERNWSVLVDLAAEAECDLSRVRVNPYSMTGLQRLIEERTQTLDASFAIDITCFTRVHVLAIAQLLATQEPARWSITYTPPQAYGELEPFAQGGWRDTLLLPLGPDPSLANEGAAIGVLLLGRDVGRATTALSYLEPAAGRIIVSTRFERPDFHRAILSRNAALIDYLKKLRMPGELGNRSLSYFPTGGWELQRIEFEAVFTEVNRVLDSVIEAAEALSSPVVLFPFGQKLTTFAAALSLTSRFAHASWAVYPVATTHPLDYTEGASESQWYSGHEIALAGSSSADGSERATSAMRDDSDDMS
jgi:hypothetical protein